MPNALKICSFSSPKLFQNPCFLNFLFLVQKWCFAFNHKLKSQFWWVIILYFHLSHPFWKTFRSACFCFRLIELVPHHKKWSIAAHRAILHIDYPVWQYFVYLLIPCRTASNCDSGTYQPKHLVSAGFGLPCFVNAWVAHSLRIQNCQLFRCYRLQNSCLSCQRNPQPASSSLNFVFWLGQLCNCSYSALVCHWWRLFVINWFLSHPIY